MFKDWTWQKWAGKVVIWAPAVIKTTLDVLEISRPDILTFVAAGVAILTTVIGLFPPKD